MTDTSTLPLPGIGPARVTPVVRAVDLDLYLDIRDHLVDMGYGSDYRWAQSLCAPADAEAFACEFTWVVLNSGMRNTVARGIMDRLWPVILAGRSARDAFGHPGKCDAIDEVWRNRAAYFARFLEAADTLAFCESLPWIGPITKWHLAKNLGLDVAKPDRWLVRIASTTGETVEALCQRLSAASGDRVATVDLLLWRACAIGLLIIGKDDRTVALSRPAERPDGGDQP